jgi:hypothetical protein
MHSTGSAQRPTVHTIEVWIELELVLDQRRGFIVVDWLTTHPRRTLSMTMPLRSKARLAGGSKWFDRCRPAQKLKR